MGSFVSVLLLRRAFPMTIVSGDSLWGDATPFLRVFCRAGGGHTSEATQPSLVYVSDSFSFMGKDQRSWVAFALDNNRGQNGNTW